MRGSWRLAVDGGEPAVNTPLPAPAPGGARIDKQEEDAVLSVLRSKRLFRYYGGDATSVSHVDHFEKSFAQQVGVPHVLGVNSGTSALACAMAAMGVGPGDEVIVPSYTWISSITSVISVGAVPILAEVDDTLCLDPEDLERKVSPFTKLIVPVHMCGAPCDMSRILNFARKHGLLVLEDAAQAIGATYRGDSVGSIGDAGAFSFQWNKLVTSGEGGAVSTRSQSIYDRAVLFHDVAGAFRVSGIPLSEVPPGNGFRMSEIQGAILGVQLRRVSSILKDLRKHKSELLSQIRPLLDEKGVRLRKMNDFEGETGTDLILLVRDGDQCRVPLMAAALQQEGVPAQDFRKSLHVFNNWIPLFSKTTWTGQGGPWRNHRRQVEYSPLMCPKTLTIMHSAIRIPLSPDFTHEQRQQVGFAIEKVVRAAL